MENEEIRKRIVGKYKLELSDSWKFNDIEYQKEYQRVYKKIYRKTNPKSCMRVICPCNKNKDFFLRNFRTHCVTVEHQEWVSQNGPVKKEDLVEKKN